MIVNDLFESGYAGNTERAVARNMNQAIDDVIETKKKAVPSRERDPGALATRAHISSQEQKHKEWAEKQQELKRQFYANHPELDDQQQDVAEDDQAKFEDEQIAESLSNMVSSAISRNDLRQIRNFVSENIQDKNKQKQIMEQATKIVAVRRRQYAARAAK